MGQGSGGVEKMHRPGNWTEGGRSPWERTRAHIRSGLRHTPKEIKKKIAEARKRNETDEG